MRSAACYAEGGAERAVRSDWNWTAAPQVGGGRQVQLQHGPYGAQPAQPMYTQYPGNGSVGPADAPTLQSQPMMAGPVFGGMAHREARDLSPRERRKRSHNAVEVKRRQRISNQLDRLKSILGCPKVDEASVLSEAVSQLNMLNECCSTLESELAHTQGQRTLATSREDASEAPSASTDVGRSDDRKAKPPAPAKKDEPVRIDVSDPYSSTFPIDPYTLFQLGQKALHELLRKNEQLPWTLMCSSGPDNAVPMKGYSVDVRSLPRPEPDEGGPRLDYCIKVETTFPVDPHDVAVAYTDTEARSTWHASCTESRVVAEVCDGNHVSMRVLYYSYRTELPVYPRGYCSLMHCATNQLGDGRTQIVIADCTVNHSAMSSEPSTVMMDVLPSGLLITPVKSGSETHSHLTLVAHFDLKGSICRQLLQASAPIPPRARPLAALASA